MYNFLATIVDTFFSLYIGLIALRFLFQIARVDFHHPLSQSIYNITNRPIKLFRAFIPGLFGLDLASIVAALLLSILNVFIKFSLLSHFNINIFYHPFLLTLRAACELIGLVLDLYFWAILAMVFLSWLIPEHHMYRLLETFTGPILKPLRRVVPPLYNLDLAPLIAIFILQGLRMALPIA